MDWVALVIGILKLGSLILTEVFEAKKRAREAQEKYELDQQKFIEMVTRSVERMRTDAKRESDQARRVEDQLDDEIRKNQSK